MTLFVSETVDDDGSDDDYEQGVGLKHTWCHLHCYVTLRARVFVFFFFWVGVKVYLAAAAAHSTPTRVQRR